MHRSGTSLLCGVLQQLGIALPGRTIAGDFHNPEGYFEWDEIVELQEQLLIDLERWWPAHEGTLPLPENWLQQPSTLQTRERLSRLLTVEAEQQTRPWAIKDPRTSRLLPLWIELVQELNIPLKIFLAVREPSQVVSSLVRRDGPITGMDANRALQLWWRHNLEVILTGRAAEHPITVVDFESWFKQPRQQCEQLLCHLPQLTPDPEQWRNALALIKPEHRHNYQTQSRTVELGPEVSRLHRRLLQNPLPKRWPSAEPPLRLRRQRSNALKPLGNRSDPEMWSNWLKVHRHFPARRFHETSPLQGPVTISCCGANWCELQPHLLLQHLPLAGLANRQILWDKGHLHELHLSATTGCDTSATGPAKKICINLELPSPERAQHWLNHLETQELIWDPDPVRVRLLRALDLPAWWLHPSGQTNGWLQHPEAIRRDLWSSMLGMGAPEEGALVVLGRGDRTWEQSLKDAAQAQYQAGQPAVLYWPGWPEILLQSPSMGLALAGWLQTAIQSSARLFTTEHIDLDIWKQWLSEPTSQPMLLRSGATVADLWKLEKGGSVFAYSEDRPAARAIESFHWAHQDSTMHPPSASVLISLYNYADRIIDALNSVSQQRQQGLELIVVDDASDDGGSLVVKEWMGNIADQAHHPFQRMLLLHHSSNAGLAAARNSAFAAAKAAWCFVLDADNALFPDAVAACLALALDADEKVAVIHPLLGVEVEPGRVDERRSLVSTSSWQKGQFSQGNIVDAMALVRRSAWDIVGGYTHIEGGWEDFDFWCKLIEADFHGVQCPKILGVYRSHTQSMSHNTTNRSWLALSHTLQQRHPWLQLPLAK